MCTRKLVTENMCEKTNKLRQFPTRWIPSYEELKSQKHSKQHRQLCQKDKKICPLRCVCVCVCVLIYIYIYNDELLFAMEFTHREF